MKNYFWITLGWFAVACGLIGVALPLVPTTPFLLLAAFAFSKGSERLHSWLVQHPRLGPPVTNWRRHGIIARRTKVYACLSMLIAFGLAWLFQAPNWALATQAAILIFVALFICSRPETKTTLEGGCGSNGSG